LGFICFGSIGRPIVFQASQPEIIATQKDEASIIRKYKQSILLLSIPLGLAGFSQLHSI
jgi:hypothetical protein